MKLSQLASETNLSIATLKSWIRLEILPPGTLKNQTTAVYGERHVERALLIKAMREEFACPLSEVASLIGIIDNPGASREDVMERCQLLATGINNICHLPDDSSPTSLLAAELVDGLLDDAQWPTVDTVARRATIAAVAQTIDLGFKLTPELLRSYAKAFETIANHDVAVVQPDGSRDVMALNVLRGASTQARLVVALNQLAHTSAAIGRHRQP